MCESTKRPVPQCLVLLAVLLHVSASSGDEPIAPVFNRAPLVEKPYAELPLGAIRPEGWLRDELQRMAGGMTGHLDLWYPEVCGPRNAWLGGDGDTWERGPYWIDGLYPLAKLLGDQELEAKAMTWVEWTLNNQRQSGQIGPRRLPQKEREQAPPRGTQTIKPDDWWPRMVMLKILQQHSMATGDRRAIACLTKYFRYQLKELPNRPLHDPDNPESGSWWAAQRGGDNLMVVLWLYNVTGEKFLLDLAELIHEQTVPVTDWFSPGRENMVRRRGDQGDSLHCVNLAQMIKTPAIRYQQDSDPRHLAAIEDALADIRTFHGQPNGLYGGDEGMHGDAPDRGSELCTAIEMMFSLEKIFEITGHPLYGDQLERVTFNALPTQCTDDHRGRQYFQQTNQVQCTFGDRDFFNDNGDRVVYGLLRGYPCCTCNLHQGWPKFAQHLWLASKDGGLAALSYAPASVTAQVADGQTVTLSMSTGYPFTERTSISIITERPVTFPLHLRIPSWASGTQLHINGQPAEKPRPGTMHVVRRQWNDGDEVKLRFPMAVRSTTWFARSKAIERGPLVYALDIEPEWKDVVESSPDGVPESAMHRGYLEARPKTDWNYALLGPPATESGAFRIEVADSIPDNPWTRETAPVRITTRGLPLPDWTLQRHSAALPPLSPAELPADPSPQEISLIPYGSTTLRIAAFPWVRSPTVAQLFKPEELRFAAVRASHTHRSDTPDAIRMPLEPLSSSDTSVPRWTSWPQRGKDQWIEIELSQPTQINSLGVYWYDDGHGIDLPESWHLQSLGPNGWEPVQTRLDQPFGTVANRYNTVDVVNLVTRSLRIMINSRDPEHCVGVLSVTIEGDSVDLPQG